MPNSNRRSSTTSKADTSKTSQGVFVALDDLTIGRLKRQAERVYGTTRGAIQSFARAAILERIQIGEQAENAEAKVSA